MIFGIGFFCGYVKDKKEVSDFCREAKEYYDEAEKRLNEAQRLLDKAHNYYEEVHAELKMIAGMRGEE
jgi:cellobiose-specific phosphotransferase system component IIA